MEIIWKTIQLSCLFFLLQSFLFRTKDFLERDFGAKADGITLNVATIQKVIDFSHEQGGGRAINEEVCIYIRMYIVGCLFVRTK